MVDAAHIPGSLTAGAGTSGAAGAASAASRAMREVCVNVRTRRRRISWMAVEVLGMIAALIALVIAMALVTGCRDTNPPPPRVPIPAQSQRQDRAAVSDPVKPLPPPPEPEFHPPFDDAPLVSQRPPEQPAFLDAYRRVGSPPIMLFVNRTLEGKIVPVNPDDPIARAEIVRQRGRRDPDTTSATVYLHPGQYDEVSAKALDYEAIENIMTDWLACSGQTTVISPMMARKQLGDEQLKTLQEGRPSVLGEVATRTGAEVLIQVQAHPTRQSPNGLEVRIVAEAIQLGRNGRGDGQSIGRAVVDVPPPLEKPTINRCTRWLARKLMDDITQSWLAPPAPQPPEAERAPEPHREPAPEPLQPAPVPGPVSAPPPAPTTQQ